MAFAKQFAGDPYFSHLSDTSLSVRIENKIKNECRFVVMGDSRSQTNIFSEIMKRVNEINPDIIISMGDLVENGGNKEQWKTQFFDISEAVINHIPFISTLGDHEGSRDEGRLFAQYFFPKKDYKKLWFSFDLGNAHFVSLDYRYPKNKEMIDWFKKDMEASNAKWKFVFMHRPCYNLGGHCSMWGREIWPALFRKYNVDIVFSGHSHIYERFLPVRPSDSNGWAVTYITTGGAGANLYDIRKNDFLASTFSDYHFIYFDIKNNILSMKVFSTNDFLFDELTINKRGNRFDKKYFSKVISQEKLNFITEFTRSLAESLTSIPLRTVPVKRRISLKYRVKNRQIKFKISLANESREFYEMESLESVLYGDKRKDFEMKIFSKCDITVSQWGEIKPPLRLEGEFEIGNEKLKVNSGDIRYWPVN